MGGGNNTVRNKTNEFNKYRTDDLIGKFTTPNKTVKRNYFGQYWRTRAAGHQKGKPWPIYVLKKN